MELSVKKYNSIDFVKLLMSICVISIHTRPFTSFTDGIAMNIYNAAVGIANPFFFLSSGFLIGKKYFQNKNGGG